MRERFVQFLQEQWSTLAHWNSLVEILFAAAGIYYTYTYFRGTRAARVLIGLVLFIASLTILSEALDLVVMRWLIGHYSIFLAVALVVMFQPELRRVFAELGSRSFFVGGKRDDQTLDRLCDCVFELAGRHYGALIALERDIGLRTYAETGVELDAAFSGELLLTIFFPKTALHDGGVIVRDGRIVAAACIFPVSQRESLERSFGLRHRAGLGLSEETDALALVVSEETGSVSLCNGRSIRRGLTRVELRRLLGQALLFESGAPPTETAEKTSPATPAARDALRFP